VTTPPFRRPSLPLAFRLAALAALCVAIYHGLAIFYPALEKVVYGAGWRPGFSPRRHLAFAFIGVTLAFLLLRRPKWLLLPYIVLVIQQFNGHGRNIWRLWTRSGLVSWAEVGLLVGFIVIGVMLVVDLRERRSRFRQDIVQAR
jgi:hypothetical protein